MRLAVAGRSLLVLDLDGTLAPIVADPNMARLRESTRQLLVKVAGRYPTVVLTGRDRRAAARLLRGVPLRMIIGNHGLDLGGSRAAKTVTAWVRQLRAQRGVLKDVLIERKHLSIAADYRGSADRAGARRRALRVAAALVPAPRVIPGKGSVNLIPNIGIDKGTTLRRLLKRFRAQNAVFVGDDATDETAFVAARGSNVLTVRVGTSSDTAAKFALASQLQIDALLRRLLQERSR